MRKFRMPALLLAAALLMLPPGPAVLAREGGYLDSAGQSGGAGGQTPERDSGGGRRTLAASPRAGGAVTAKGLTLAFADGNAPQAGSVRGEGDYYDGSFLYLHPQEGKELLLSGIGESVYLFFAYPSPTRRAFCAGLAGDVKARGFSVGGFLLVSGENAYSAPTDLALNGGGHTIQGDFIVAESSRAEITGGLTVDGPILVCPDAVLKGSGPFAQTGGHEVSLQNNALFALRDRPSAGWLNRLRYEDPLGLYPDGQARAIFSDGEFTVSKDGVTRVTAPGGSVTVAGFTLAFADGSTPQAGAKWDEGDYYDSGNLLFHPQGNKKLLLSGGDGSEHPVFALADPARHSFRAGLTGDVKARRFGVGLFVIEGSIRYPAPADLALAGGGHTVQGEFYVHISSRVEITGGLTVDGPISLSPDAVLEGSGPFAQTGGQEVRLYHGALFALRDRPSAGWLDRLRYEDSMGLYPDGQARAVFSDGEFTVSKDGVTRVSAPGGGGGGGGGGSGGDSSGWYVIEASAGPGGSISPAGRTHVAEGKDQKFTITPDEGYVVKRLVVDSQTAPAADEYLFEDVRQGHRIYAEFERGNAAAPGVPAASPNATAAPSTAANPNAAAANPATGAKL